MAKQFILVVDDEPGIALLCKRLLVREGYTVETFTDPRQAVTYISEHPINLLLVDIRMPEVDGFEVIEHTQRLQPDTAILIMTGHGTVETAIRALRKGVDGLVLKPFDQGRDLVSVVNQAIVDNQQKRDAGRTKALRPLFAVTESLFSETRREKIVELIVDAVCDHLHCSIAAYYQRPANEKNFTLLSYRGGAMIEDQEYQINDLLHRVDISSMPLIVNIDKTGDYALKPILETLGLGSTIIASNTRPGFENILFAGRLSSEPTFRESDQELFQILIRQAAIAMENSNLYAEQVDHVRKIEASQKALLQAEKLATAGRLTASIAHEVNNPLQAVENCLHLARHDDLTPARQRDYLNMAYGELERLRLTVQRMLDYYRPGGSSYENVNIGEALSYVINLMSRQLTENGIKITFNLPASLPTVLADRNQLQQVFINLILNASDAMPQGGKLTISGRAVNGGIEILFNDNGTGISSAQQEKIFEPFFSTKNDGSGLGLTVSSNIVTAHGGTLELIPKQESGACFRLFLPSGDKK